MARNGVPNATRSAAPLRTAASIALGSCCGVPIQNRPISFVGENFSYRPYFQDAIKGADVPDDIHERTEAMLSGLMEGGGPENSANIRAKLQEVMWDHASVVRTDESLGQAIDEWPMLVAPPSESILPATPFNVTAQDAYTELGKAVDRAAGVSSPP